MAANPNHAWSALRGTLAAAVGVARTPELIAAGYSRRDLERAVERGVLVRVCRGWVAVPDADPELVAAARNGVVLTCITQARRSELWVLAEDRCHVAADRHRGGPAPERATVHWAAPMVPRAPGMLADPIENVLAAVASCQPFEAAVAVWDSALRRELVTKKELARRPLRAA